MELQNIDPQIFRVIVFMTFLTLPLKGWALWRSAHNDQRGWFIAMMLINTIGLLELTYLFYFSKPKAKTHTED